METATETTTENAYPNGCPRSAWCVNCNRPIALMATGDPVPHGKGGMFHAVVSFKDHDSAVADEAIRARAAATPTRTLLEVAPHEFAEEFADTQAWKMRDVNVVAIHSGGFGGAELPWPGREKNVFNWYELENGYAVGWNENPSRGWSFPVVKMKASS